MQKDLWSLYWKESMETKTEMLEDVTLDVQADATAAEVLKTIAEKQGWQPVDTLLRLEGRVVRLQGLAGDGAPQYLRQG